MAKGKRGPIDYIRSKPGTRMLYFRYQFPVDVPGKGREFSLRTSDPKVARERAAHHLIQCVRWVEEVRAQQNANSERRPTTTLDYAYSPGEHILDDGTRIIAEEDWYYMSQPGRPMRHARNRIRRVVDNEGMTLEEYVNRVETDTLHEDEIDGEDCPGWRGEPIELPANWEPGRVPVDGGIAAKPLKSTPVRPCADDEHLERWIKHRNITGHLEREAQTAWVKFRELTGGKPLKDCDRDDGRKLVAYYFDQGKKRATVQRKIFPLRAMISLAMAEGKLRFNPFSDIIRKEMDGDALKREDFTEEDMALVRKNRANFTDQEWLLWVLLATTEMRLSEAIKIEGEKHEHGIRYIQIKHGKTKQSQRDVPLPDAVVELHPQPIEGRLFPSWKPEVLSKRMNRRVNDIGITDPLKVIHSLRHRAKSKLRKEQECKLSIEYALLGHEKITTAARYGKRPPMTVLKPWIEKIGY